MRSLRRRTNMRDMSRLEYRMHRLWLTPAFRAFLKRGVPLLMVAAIVGLTFADQTRRAAVPQYVAHLRQQFEDRPEFRINMMTIDGASAELAEDIREILPIDFPISSFDLDLPHIRQATLDLDAVAAARVQIRPGGELNIKITERVPAIVWRAPQGLMLLDKNGHRVGALAARNQRHDLPVIAGEGADAHVPEAQAILRSAGPLSARVIGLERVGERRWDVALDRGQRILLPAEGAVRAMERVVALTERRDLLERDAVLVDMRLPIRPTVRLGEAAHLAFLKIKGVVTEEASQ